LSNFHIPYQELPRAVQDNLSEHQWRLAQREAALAGDKLRETGMHINLKHGQR
jgi:hypothetical protein